MSQAMTQIRLAAPALCLVGLLAAVPGAARDANGMVVYQTDFGLKDGAVAAMRGVAASVEPTFRSTTCRTKTRRSTSGRRHIG